MMLVLVVSALYKIPHDSDAGGAFSDEVFFMMREVDLPALPSKGTWLRFTSEPLGRHIEDAYVVIEDAQLCCPLETDSCLLVFCQTAFFPSFLSGNMDYVGDLAAAGWQAVDKSMENALVITHSMRE